MSEIQKTLNERASKYGDFRDHASLAIDLKERMRSSNSWADTTPYMKEALDMIQHKIARILNGDVYYEDSWVDIIGYAQLALDRVRSDNLDISISKELGDAISIDISDKFIADFVKDKDSCAW